MKQSSFAKNNIFVLILTLFPMAMVMLFSIIFPFVQIIKENKVSIALITFGIIILTSALFKNKLKNKWASISTKNLIVVGFVLVLLGLCFFNTGLLLP